MKHYYKNRNYNRNYQHHVFHHDGDKEKSLFPTFWTWITFIIPLIFWTAIMYLLMHLIGLHLKPLSLIIGFGIGIVLAIWSSRRLNRLFNKLSKMTNKLSDYMNDRL